MAATWVIERLRGDHVRAEFACGDASLDQFLKTLVSQYQKRGLGQTYVAVRPGDVRVLGFYTISAGVFDASAAPASLRKRLPKHPVPTVHLGRMAVDRPLQKQGLGRTLLFNALWRSLRTSHDLGIYAVDVIAKGDEARNFYTKFGFLTLEDQPLHLFLPMATVAAMFAKSPDASP